MVSYKLTKHFETRKITSSSPLDWPALSTQLDTLFGMPAEFSAVSYLDEDGDVITLSSNKELDEYYRAHDLSQLIKFDVFDLRQSRGSSSLGQQTPISQGHRDTFGLPFNMDDDWERLPTGLSQVQTYGFTKTDSERFEELSSSSIRSVPFANRSDSRSDRSDITIPPPRADKGKGRAQKAETPLDASNLSWVPGRPIDHIGSVLQDDKGTPSNVPHMPSPPSSIPAHRTVSPAGPSERNTPDPYFFGVPLRSTPVQSVVMPQTVTVKPSQEAEVVVPAEPEATGAAVSDPPSPVLEATATPDPTFGGDLTDLFASISAAISAHPEITEKIRSIVQRTTSGQYLSGTQENIQQAAQQLSARSTEELRRAEMEANQRVASAVGSFFRLLASGVDAAGRLGQSSSGGNDEPNEHLFASMGPWQSTLQSGRRAPRMENPFGPLNPLGPPTAASMHPWAHQPEALKEASRSKPTTAELRAQVEAAKMLYKAEKERYRAEREERKREKARKAGVAREQLEPAPQESPQKNPSLEPTIAINSRGAFPAMEIVNVPRRAHTIAQPPSRFIPEQLISGPSEHREQGPRKRILRRLEDMGFSVTGYPNVVSQVEEQLRGEKVITKEREDDIVTTVLDDLLAASPRPGQSGSKASIPGGWN